MSHESTRREVLGHAARGAGLLGLAGAAGYLTTRAAEAGVWQLDGAQCLNSKLGETGVAVCDQCAVSCVLEISAVRAVNEIARCGRCCICPAYYDVMSETNEDGLPSRKLCPRDAIDRKAIGEVDPDDPANNFYEYVIDEDLCNGCGECVMGCKEPAGLGSIRLEVRHRLCHNCNRCTIAVACPEHAFFHKPFVPARDPKEHT